MVGSSGVSVTPPSVALAGLLTSLTLSLPPTTPQGLPWPDSLKFVISEQGNGHVLAKSVLYPIYASNNATVDGLSLLQQELEFTAPAAVKYSRLRVSLLANDTERLLWTTPKDEPLWLWSIPSPLSILPPVAAVFFALLMRQVIIALALGVWIGAMLIHGFNPLTGALRFADHFMPHAFGDGSHPLIITFTVLLGGTIAVVRASGGAAGIAAIATRCTKKPSQVLVAAAVLGLFVGVDDYAAVLITGGAMEPIASALGVHKLRLAWVVHGVGVCMASINPLSSWFGAQLALVAEQVAILPGLQNASPLLMILSTTPYRLYPILHILHIFLTLLLPWGKDYGRMAIQTGVAGRAYRPTTEIEGADGDGGNGAGGGPSSGAMAGLASFLIADSGEGGEGGDGERESGVLDGDSVAESMLSARLLIENRSDDGLDNRFDTLAMSEAEISQMGDEGGEGGSGGNKPPKPPPRALFALLPFGSMLIGTPIGMYLDGRNKMSASALASATLLDVLAAANSTAALTWSTLLANALAILLPLGSSCIEHRLRARTLARAEGEAEGATTAAPPPLHRFTLAGLMAQWVEGVQECMEALLILVLAWALGSVVTDLHTADFLATALGAWLPASLLPLISMLLAMVVSFGIGSAWGTFGVLIPLVAPLSWRLSNHDEAVLIASLGAVYGGAVFGNVSSPLADTSVLSSMVCRCDMLRHVASQSTYTALTATLSLLLGALPVGMGWYPIGVALALGVVVISLAPVAAPFCTGASKRAAQMKRKLGFGARPASGRAAVVPAVSAADSGRYQASVQ